MSEKSETIYVEDMLVSSWPESNHPRWILSANGICVFLKKDKGKFTTYIRNEYFLKSRHFNMSLQADGAISPNGACYIHNLLKNDFFEIKRLGKSGEVLETYTFKGIEIVNWYKYENIISIMFSYKSMNLPNELTYQKKGILANVLTKIRSKYLSWL